MKKEKLKYHTDISIQTLYSVLSWSTFGSDYSLESSWVWPRFGDFLPFFSSDPLKLCQVGCQWTAIFRALQRFSIRCKSGICLGHSRTFTVVPKPLLCRLGCVLRVINLLEGKPSAKPEALSPLDQVFIKDISGLCSVQLSLNPEKSPSPCHWKTPPQHNAATTMLHRWDGIGHPDMMLRIEAKLRFNLGLIRPDNLLSHSLRVVLVLFWKRAFICLSLRRGICVATLP